MKVADKCKNALRYRVRRIYTCEKVGHLWGKLDTMGIRWKSGGESGFQSLLNITDKVLRLLDADR